LRSRLSDMTAEHIEVVAVIEFVLGHWGSLSGLSGVGLAGTPWPGPTCLDRAAARREILPRPGDSEE
jgi:hypothetical protein